MLGNFEKASMYFKKGLNVLLSIKHLSTLGVAEAMHGLSFVVKGDGKNAIKHFERSIQYFEEGRTVFMFSVIWTGLSYNFV